VAGLVLAYWGLNPGAAGVTAWGKSALGLVWNVSGSDPVDRTIVVTSAAVCLLLCVYYLVLHFGFPKVAAISLATTRECLAQPVFWLCLVAGILLLLIFVWLPFNTFGEDVKMLKDTSLPIITIIAMLLAVLTSSVSVADEIEGRTALTLLSKPVGRRQFVFGKFLGVIGPIVVLLFVLGLVFLGTVSYKTVYDAAENSKFDVGVQDCRAEVIQIAPGLALAMMETIVLIAISVTISTRLPMLPNLMICFAVYAIGHIVPVIVQSAAKKGQLETVSFVGQLLATVLPVLEHFNMSPAIMSGRPVTIDYLLWALLYCFIYSAFALLGALVLFEDRDLA
jgi:ABC-type transport system involved in multi-copper enzyme maturation permease subunit